MTRLLEVYNDVPRVLVGYIKFNIPERGDLVNLLSIHARKVNLRLQEIPPTSFRRLHVVKVNSASEVYSSFYRKGVWSLYPLRAIAWVTMQGIRSTPRRTIIGAHLPFIGHDYYQ